MKENGYNYPFRFILTAIDTETGQTPEDLEQLGTFRFRIWEYIFDADEEDSLPETTFTEIKTQKCTDEQLEAF